MAITTLAAAKAGLVRPSLYVKVQGQSPSGAAAPLRAISPWYTAGTPGAGTASSAGVDGEALSAPVNAAMIRANPAGGSEARIAHLSARYSREGTVLLIDRLWQNSGLSVTSTSPQSISAVSLPARDINGSSNGDGVFAAIEWSAAGGAGTPTVTLTYDDQDGNPGATGTFTALASPVAGTMEIFSLAAGDTGIRVPTSFQQDATRTSGTMHLVLFRIVAMLPLQAAHFVSSFDTITGPFTKIYDDSVLYPILLNTTTAANTVTLNYQETHG
jgi:hypothetical protein